MAKSAPALTHQLISIASAQAFQCLAITSQVRDFARQQGGREGAVVVSGQHTTTAVIINELVLGTYQDVILVELDGPRQRKVSLQWLSSSAVLTNKPSRGLGLGISARLRS